MKAAVPWFRYTSIRLNCWYASKLRVDSNNLDPSMIIALGKYTQGGDLWIHDDGNGNDLCAEHGKGERMAGSRWHHVERANYLNQ